MMATSHRMERPMADQPRDKKHDGPAQLPTGEGPPAADGRHGNVDGLPGNVDGEDSTRVLTGDSKKRYKSMHGALKRIEKRAARMTDGKRRKGAAPARPESGAAKRAEATAPVARMPSASELASSPVDLPDSAPDNVPVLRASNSMPTALVDLSSKPTKRTIRSARPALAGTGSTESYSDHHRDAIRDEIEQARAPQTTTTTTAPPATSKSGGPRVVVQVDDENMENTWVSGTASHVPAPRVQRCSLRKRVGSGYVIQRHGHAPFALPRTRMLAVAIGVLVDHPGAGEETPVIDVVTNWGSEREGPVIMRFNANEAPLKKLFPTIRGHIAAVSALVIEMAEGSTAKRLPTTPNWPGPPFQRFASEDVMNLALYGNESI